MKMKTWEDVKHLATEGESDKVEFKTTTGQLERAMETLCAFLNGSGGSILFGVTDEGRVVGQEVSDKTKRDIAEALNQLEPTAAIAVSYIAVPNMDKKVIALSAEAAPLGRPYLYRGRPYHRIESTTSVMPQAVYNDLLLRRDGGKYRWELFEDHGLTLQDIDGNEVLKTVRLGIESGRLPEDTGSDLPVILEKFGLLRHGILNHAAAVLFAKGEMVEYPQCLLRLARFKGTDRTTFMDSQRVQGNLFHLLNTAMAFIFKHLSLSGTIDSLEREEHLSIPYKAIREGVVNALCHRDYRTSGGSTGIAIYDDRVEIENPGAFPHDWDLAKLKEEHCSEPQNPAIANVLYKRRLLENWGRGISLMSEECEKNGLPDPTYRVGNGHVVLVFRYHTSATQAPHKHHTSTTQVETLVSAMGQGTYSVKEMMALLQLKNRSHFAKEYLKPALETGAIEPTHPNQPNHPRQKYHCAEAERESTT